VSPKITVRYPLRASGGRRGYELLILGVTRQPTANVGASRVYLLARLTRIVHGGTHERVAHAGAAQVRVDLGMPVFEQARPGNRVAQLARSSRKTNDEAAAVGIMFHVHSAVPDSGTEG
jgi:hypothetical protein